VFKDVFKDVFKEYLYEKSVQMELRSLERTPTVPSHILKKKFVFEIFVNFENSEALSFLFSVKFYKT